MLIHTSQIDPQGTHLCGTENEDILQLDEPGIKVASMVGYDLNVGLADDGIFAAGKLEVDIEFNCVRCNESFPAHIVVNDFAMQEDLLGTETFDLTPFMREDILLNLPMHPRCDEIGGKECHGANVESDPAPKKTGDDRWNALDELDLPDKN